MKPEGSQEPTTCPYSEPVETSQHPNMLFL
jgi:hypothetical protein